MISPADDPSRGVYGISVAAELLGMGSQNLRAYERHGLVEPARTDGGTRRYSNDDLDRLRRIGELLAGRAQPRRHRPGPRTRNRQRTATRRPERPDALTPPAEVPTCADPAFRSSAAITSRRTTPRRERLPGQALLPPPGGVPPQGGGGGAQGEAAGAPGLGRSDDLGGGAAGDGQHVTVQIGEPQGGELTAASTGVGRQPDQQQHLFGPAQPGATMGCAATPVSGRGRPNRRVLEDGADRLDRGVLPNGGLGRAAHPLQRVLVQDSFGVRPAQRRAKHPHPAPGVAQVTAGVVLLVVRCIPSMRSC